MTRAGLCFALLLLVSIQTSTAWNQCTLGVVQNPSFEDATIDFTVLYDSRPTFKVDCTSGNLDGWTCGGGVRRPPGGESVWTQGNNQVTTHDGSNYLVLQKDGAYVQQTLQLVVGAKYRVRFTAGARSHTASITDETLKVTVGTKSWQFSGLSTEILEPKEFEFTASAASAELIIENYYPNDSAADQTIFIDNVRMQMSPSVDVQNPSFEDATIDETAEFEGKPTYKVDCTSENLDGWTCGGGVRRPPGGESVWTQGNNQVTTHDGSNYLVLQRSQAFVEQSLELLVGAAYRVRFTAGKRLHAPTVNDQKVKVTVGAREWVFTGLNTDRLDEKEFVFTATASSQSLRFANFYPTNGAEPDQTVFIDNVRVDLLWRDSACEVCSSNADCFSSKAECKDDHSCGPCEMDTFWSAGNCTVCDEICDLGFNETTQCTPTTDRECTLCPAGYSCVDGVPTPCEAAEGFFCPAGHPAPPTDGNRRDAAASDALEGIPCPAGYYCAGGAAPALACTADAGFYCPEQFAPTASSLEQGLAGRRCPPMMFCSGNTSQPIQVDDAVCDLVQACGASANGTCEVRQSTFFKFNDPPALFAVDQDGSTCMKTANAVSDSNPQWVRVSLGQERLVGTVRFLSAGAAADFEVRVNANDFVPVTNPQGVVVANPSVGGEIPTPFETCAVQAVGEGVFEAVCAPATKGEFIFILRASADEVLEVCDIEVFGHQCLYVPEQELSCGLGYQPSVCTSEDALCRGCVPCPPGTYSDKVGDYQCTLCPGHALYGEVPYSPEGSTSMFQCEGDAQLDGTSTLGVETVAFNTTIDAWEIVIDFAVAPRVQINGVSTLFLSKGGAASPANDGTFLSKNFPCRADASRAAGSDVSASLEETVCCLQDMRQDYLMTQIFRDFTDGLDLVAANDKCDAEDGSNVLVNADLEVVGEGTTFVDTNGQVFSNSITVTPLASTETRRSHETYTGTQRAKITIPDAELYKVSKSLNPDGNLTDSRELFIGLLDLLPTGTRVVDSASQRISIVLTRTQYGTFAAYGEQNIDYDFISFLNARAHKVISGSSDQYYAEVTFVYDDRLQPVNATGAVELDTVTVNNDAGAYCAGSSASIPGFQDAVGQDCGPKDLPWTTEACPQVSIPDDHFGRLYIPLVSNDVDEAGVVHIEFALWFTDMGGRNDRVTLAMDLVVEDFVTWCDADSGSVDLAQLVTPRIFVGTEADSPPRLTGWSDMEDNSPFATGAETLQDGMVTLILDLDDSKVEDEDNVNSLDNLEVFFEDVLVIHVNPGSQPDINEIKNAVTDGNSKYAPTHNYDPDSRDAWLNIPPALKTDCPAEDATTSFFGCVHKHILRNKIITNETDAYFVGSSPPPAAGAQDFVETMLGDGTASVAARELGRDFEQYLMTTEGVTGSSPKSIGLWINPGHKWGGVTANSEYSLSNHLIIHVLFGVRSGIAGTERRMLLSTNGDGTTSLVRTLEYNVNAATLVESVMDDVVAIGVEARLALSAEEACLALASLREICSARLRAAVAPHASMVERVECVSVRVEKANCDGSRRAAAAPVAVVDAVIALAQSADAFLDMDAVVASGSVLAMKQTAGTTLAAAPGDTPTPAGNVEATPAGSEEASGSGSSSMIIGAAAGAAAGVVLMAFGAWKASTRCKAPAEPLSEVVSVKARGVAEPVSEKARIEDLLFSQGH